MNEDFMPIIQAAEYAGISRVKLWRLIRDGKLSAYTSARDGRVKLVRRGELDAALRPMPVEADRTKIAA